MVPSCLLLQTTAHPSEDVYYVIAFELFPWLTLLLANTTSKMIRSMLLGQALPARGDPSMLGRAKAVVNTVRSPPDRDAESDRAFRQL
jgi:hypothetical protein